jgi:uncharacterized protein
MNPTSNSLPRVLLLGDQERAPYHPVGEVKEELQAIWKDLLHLDCTEDYDALLYEHIREYSMMVSYTDCWKSSVTDEQAAGLVRYVQEGGSLYLIHTGISLQVHDELFRLFGARFTGHPPYQRLIFHPVGAFEGIGGGSLPSFEMEEEPYRFEFEPDAGITVLLEYDWEGTRLPAAWHRSFGLGRMVYVMPGHHKESFLLPAYREWLRAGAQWLLQQA